MRPRIRCRAWRAFDERDRRAIRSQLAAGIAVRCPRCHTVLEARPTTRLSAALPAGAGGFDLDCRPCRRFHAQIRHTARSLYALRLRRLAAAVLRA